MALFGLTWEQRKLSEVADIIGGGTPSTGVEEYWDGDIDWYAPAEINDQIYVDCSERKITRLGLENSSAKILPANKTVLFTSRAGIGKTAILRHDGATNQGFQSMVLNDETNPYFVFSMSSIIKEKAERVASGSTFAEISRKLLGNLEFWFPSKAEQDKIGGYFENLDHLITLHQRQYSLIMHKSEISYDKSKKNINCTTWEQRKLGDVVGVYDGVHQTPEYQASGIMFLSVENIATLISDKFISEDAFKRDYKVYPEKGDILMTRIGDVGTTNVVETTKKLAFYVSLALLKPLGADSYFLSNVMQSPLFKKGLKNRTLVTAIPQKINKDEIGKVEVFLPQNKDEQERIGAYFKNLDHLITLHQRKLFCSKMEVFLYVKRIEENRAVL